MADHNKRRCCCWSTKDQEMVDLEEGVEGSNPSHEHNVDGERVSEEAQAVGAQLETM